MKKNFSLISSMASILILFMTLIISVSYAWYANNKEVDASGGIASTASNSISILNQGVYKDVIGDDPFLDNENKNEVGGVLSGDIIYYSVAIELSQTKNINNIYDINISVFNINGGEYFVSPAIKVIDKPEGVLTGNTYLYEDTEYQTYVFDDEEYFVINVDENEYIYYLYESASGDILTRRPQLVFSDPNGSLTNTLFEFDGVKYPTYLDSKGKEYFKTYDNGDTYVNYIYEEIVNGEVTRYNMCDVYTIGLFKVFGVDNNDKYNILVNNEDSLEWMDISKESGLDKEVNSFNLYDYSGWKPSEYKEIVFTFAIKFDYEEFEGKINTNCVSDKELIFTNVVITDTEREVAD